MLRPHQHPPRSMHGYCARSMNVLMSANQRLLSKIPIVKIDNHLYLQKDNFQFEKPVD